MNRELCEKIADAVLYEGYMLYPYRPSAIKNRQRWTFGTVYPPAYDEVSHGTESDRMHSECLCTANEISTFHVQLRFLHLLDRQISNAAGEQVPSLNADGRILESWDEGVPRSVEFDVPKLAGQPVQISFRFPDHLKTELLRNAQGQLLGSLTRTQQGVIGTITCSAEKVQDNVHKLSIDVRNETVLTCDRTDRKEALPRSLLSTHIILSAENAEFLSLLDPPAELLGIAHSCRNTGNFPVLVGEAGSRDMVLCSPITLYDYPQVAPESIGDFYDSTEMDEMLTLRVMTLTDEEKNEMRMADDRVRSLLQRTEESAREQLMRTHGTIRSLRFVGDDHD